MTATAPVPSLGIAGQATSTRVVSIDIFRGLTMAVMIFVNDLDSVHGLSKWTYHMPSNVDAMTYVDMVFPAFLFIVGMALPIAVKQRLKRNPSVALLWLHVVLRAAGLLVLGLILANADLGDAVRMHISPDAWAILSLVGAVLLWNVYVSQRKGLVLALRLTGAALIVSMFAIFRRATPTGEAWIAFSYPEILGLIGLTYFAVCLIYIPTRRWRFAPCGLAGIAGGLQRRLCRQVASHGQGVDVSLALWQWSDAESRDGWGGHVRDFSGGASLEPPAAEDAARVMDGWYLLYRRMVSQAAGYLKDSCDAYMGPLDRGSLLRVVHGAILALRYQEANGLGLAGAYCGF